MGLSGKTDQLKILKFFEGVVWTVHPVSAAGTSEDSAVYQAIATGNTELGADIDLHSLFPSPPASVDSATHSIIVVPLKFDGRIVGIFGLHGLPTNPYGPREQRILEQLAEQISPAVEHARLSQELRAKNQEMEFVDQVAKIITSTLDIADDFSGIPKVCPRA